MLSRRELLARTGLMACALGLSPSLARGQTRDAYPARAVKVIVTDPAGAAVDVIARIFTERLSALLGQQFVIENKPGATGLIAAKAAAGSNADGYTLLAAAASTFTILPAQNDRLGIDLAGELAPISLFGELPQIIAVSSLLPVASLSELIAHARKEPGGVICGTNGSGTLPNFTARRFADEAKAPMTIVPYASGGTSAVMADILGGRVHVAVSSLSALQGLIRSGHLKVLGIATQKRLSNYPDWPAVNETLPGFTAVGWSALLAPARTPDAILELINAAMRTVAEEPAIVARLHDLGTYPRAMNLADIRRFIEAEQKVWWPIVKANAA